MPEIPKGAPAPWKIEPIDAGFRIVAANGTKVAYIYSEAEPVRRSIVEHLTPEDAAAVAKVIVSLPT